MPPAKKKKRRVCNTAPLPEAFVAAFGIRGTEPGARPGATIFARKGTADNPLVID